MSTKRAKAQLIEHLETLLVDTRQNAVQQLIKKLRTKDQLNWFTDHLEFAQQSADLLREPFRSWVFESANGDDPRVTELRGFLGWKEDARDFDELEPEFLDVAYLLPPRDQAITETLAPLIDHLASDHTSPDDVQRNAVFEIGAGTGLLLHMLRVIGVKGNMLGIDPAPKLARFAVQTLKQHGPTVITTHAIQELPRPSEKYAGALCYMVLHHVAGDEESQLFHDALGTIFDSLEEGGIFVYTDKLCAGEDASNESPFIDFRTSGGRLTLESGQELEILPTHLKGLEPFRPHPGNIPEVVRYWKDVAEELSRAGFLIIEAKPLNKHVFHFTCRKPVTSIWVPFAYKASPQFIDALSSEKMNEHFKGEHGPYQWCYPCLDALYRDVISQLGIKDGGDRKLADSCFLKGIAYFSWERASRLFLVRRAVPHEFHLLSYSHVHEGWGSLGRMVEEFEDNATRYKGYTHLTRDAVQRTLPFLGDIDKLGYDAAMAVPIYRNSNRQLRGAFLFFVKKREYIPLHTGSQLQKGLVRQFGCLNISMNGALDLQDEQLGTKNSSELICDRWDQEVEKHGNELVIAKLDLRYYWELATPSNDRSLLEVCSSIQALLSGSECFSVLDERNLAPGNASILVAARFDLSFDEIRDKILAAVGTAADDWGPLSYTCLPLGSKSSPSEATTT